MVSNQSKQDRPNSEATDTPRLSEVGRDIAQQVREQAEDAAHRARRAGRSVLHGQKERAISELGTISDAVWQAADKLREEDDHNVAGLVEGVAARLDNVADYLRQHHLEDALADLSAFGRRRPEILMGGMFCVGLAIGRFLKASPPPLSADPYENDLFGDRGGSPSFGLDPERHSAEETASSKSIKPDQGSSPGASPPVSDIPQSPSSFAPPPVGGTRIDPEGTSAFSEQTPEESGLAAGEAAEATERKDRE